MDGVGGGRADRRRAIDLKKQIDLRCGRREGNGWLTESWGASTAGRLTYLTRDMERSTMDGGEFSCAGIP